MPLSLPGFFTGRTGRRFSTALAVAGALGTFGLASAQVPQRQSFTEADVKAVLEELRGVDPRTYLIRLPAFRSGRIVGSNTYGTLPITEVRRVASLLNVQLNESANVITAIELDGGDESGGSSDTNAYPGPTQTSGRDLGDRIGQILSAIDSRQYQFLR